MTRLQPLAIATLLATALAAAEPAPAELRLDAKPAGVNRSTTLWFEDGKPTGGQESLSIQLQAVLPEGLNVLEVKDVSLVEAQTDSGTAVVADPDNNASGDPGDASMGISINLLPPPAGTLSLRKLVVSATIRTAEPGQRRASLKPASGWIAKRMRVDGYAGAEVELEDLGADALTLGMTPKLAEVLADLSFRSAAGTEVEHQGWNDHHETGWVARQVQVQLPADGEIVLSLHRGITSRRVVLTASDLPISLPDRRKTAVGSLPTVDIAPGQAADPLKIEAAIEPAGLTPVPAPVP